MDDKELYQQKQQAKLDEWKAELEKLKARARGAEADAQIELNERIRVLEGKIEDGRSRLDELAEASDEAWGTLKDGVESAWTSLSAAFSDAASKFRK